MAENNTTAKATKKSWFKGMAAEFKKIIWPDKETVTKESIAVIVVSAILAAIIVILDLAITSGLNLIV